MSRKYTIEEIRKSFEQEDYILISTEYKNSRTKLSTICSNGHTYRITFTKWLSGRRCLCNSGKRRLTLNYIKKCFDERGYILLSESYRSGQKLKYICPNGHKHSTKWDHFDAGHGCPYCNGRPVIRIEDIKFVFENEGYTLLTTVYKNSKQKLDYICSKGHKHSITWYNWKTGYRCPECAPNMKKTLDFIRKEIEKENYVLVTNEYINRNQKLHLICPNGHDYFVSWNNWKGPNSRCVLCSDWGTSQQEKELISFVKTICTNVIEHDRVLIKPYELDIVIPEKKIAIEYCGLYWHSDLAGKDKKYHLKKLEMCNKKDYRLITIFEDELVFNKDLVFSRLRNFLHKEKGKKVFARKCVVKEIDVVEAKLFCNDNHVQGYGGGAKIKLGIFYENGLVGVMTFSRPSVAKGTKTKDITIWELHRFCSKIDYRIVGGASKLLKHFERNYNWSKIFSYADRRWSDGHVYEQLGFSFGGYIRPNYWYINKQRRLHRFNLRKMYADPKHITEWEIRKSQGWNRIWDCGNLKYVKFKSN